MTALQPAQPSLDSSPGSPVHEPRDSLDLPDLYSAETMWSDLELQQLDGAATAARGLTEMGAGSSAAEEPIAVMDFPVDAWKEIESDEPQFMPGNDLPHRDPAPGPHAQHPARPCAGEPSAVGRGTLPHHPPSQKRPLSASPSGSPRQHKRPDAGAEPAYPPLAQHPPPQLLAQRRNLPGPGSYAHRMPTLQDHPLLEQPLPSQVAYQMIITENFRPGARPLWFDPRQGVAIFKEDVQDRGANARNRADHKPDADRWHNSGGQRGARDMPAEMPIVRRRYGSVSRAGTIYWRFHQYCLIRWVADSSFPKGYRVEEDRSTVIFHIMPKREGRGRPSKVEAEMSARLWAEFGFGGASADC